MTELVQVRRVSDAVGAHCPDCGAEFYHWDAWPPWGWRHRQRMHERGTGHIMILIGVKR